MFFFLLYVSFVVQPNQTGSQGKKDWLKPFCLNYGHCSTSETDGAFLPIFRPKANCLGSGLAKLCFIENKSY